MRKSVLALAAFAAVGFSGVAFAGEAATTTAGPAAMSDSDLDGVVA